ncbi:MAG: hypothetical protein JRI25_02580 [Deltaproteobacteria bacterium]|nr:hypothetical protein [Deltaproteobacteria bacterium]
MHNRVVRVLPLLVLLSCGGPQPDTPPTEDARPPGDTLVIAEQTDIGNLMSVVSESEADGAINENLAYSLVDIEFDCSMKKLPGLATDWAWSNDGTVLKMTLRDDITFQDGTKVTARDIEFTYDLVADPLVASPRVSYIERMVPGKHPLVIDDTHIEWHFTEAYDRDTQVAHASALALLPKHKLESADRATLRGHAYSKNPLASGPFKLALYEPNTRIVLEPNENFTGPEEDRAKLDKVIFKIIPEYSTRLIELQNGDVDFMRGITVADADLLRKNNPEVRLVRRGWRSMDYVAWNLNNPMFQDQRVRRALAMSVNIDDIIAKVLTSETGESYARRAVGTITPALCGVHNDDITPLPHDVEKAKALFAEAGWEDHDGDGFLDKDGERFEFTLTTNTGNKRRADVSILLQAHLERVGVKMNIEKQESNTFFENLRQKDYEAALGGWSAGLFVDPATLWHSDVECGPDAAADCKPRKYEFNFTGYNNPRADELMQQGMGTPIPMEAAPVWKEMQQVIYDDQPYLFLWWMDEIVGIHERVEDYEIDVLSALNHLNRWRVPEEKIKYRR